LKQETMNENVIEDEENIDDPDPLSLEN